MDDRDRAHIGDDDLVLDYYGELEADDRERVHAHLASCAGCQRADQDVRAFLRLVDVMPAAEPPAQFEQEMWTRIAPHIHAAAVPAAPRRFEWLSFAGAPDWRRVAWAGGVAAALVAAFVLGRSGSPVTRDLPQPGAITAAATRERVLDAEVEDHFERSERVLTELVNAEGPRPVALEGDRARAADLVAAGRVYRRSAHDLGDAATGELLEDLERVLLDVANASPNPTPDEVRDLRDRIDEQDLVFRLRVVGSELRRRQRSASATF